MSERGMVTAGLLILTPLALSLIALTMAAYLVLVADSRSRHFCRVELLRNQEEVARDLKALMDLNPRARALRHRRTIARAKLASAAAGSPAAMTAGAELAQVELEQKDLASKQQSLILRARSRSRAAPPKVLVDLHLRVREMQAAGAAKAWRASAKLASFELIAFPPASTTPDYYPGPGFPNGQEMSLTWSFPAESLLPAWLRPLAAASGLQVRAECSATLEKEKEKWVAKLRTARS